MPRKPKVFISAEQLDELTSSYSDPEIGAMFGLPKGSIIKRRYKYGVKSFTEKTGLIRVNGESVTKYNNMLDNVRSLAPSEHVLKGKSNPKVRKNFFDERFFSVIDSEAKAYFLGFIAADGCVTGKCTEISIKDSDIQILQDFKEVLNYTGEITYARRSPNDGYGGTDRVRLRLNSNLMVQDLATHGVTPRKTFTQRFPTTIPYELERHFVRGLWDGDGHVGRTNTIIVGCTPLLNDVNQCFQRHNLPELLLEPVKSVFRLRGRRGDKPVLDWLYKDCDVVLLRKKAAYISFWT